MILTTDRCILRPWEDADTDSLYAYASDPLVGRMAGWLPHRSWQESRLILTLVYLREETYAICPKEEGEAVGMINFMAQPYCNLSLEEREKEVGFWLGSPFWGEGIMTEVLKEMVRHGFEDLGLLAIWGACYEENVASRRVMEKNGFRYEYSKEGVFHEATGETHNELVLRLLRPQ